MKALNSPRLKPSTREELEEKLKLPNIPDGCEEIWNVYWELFTGERLSFTEIQAYANLNGITFTRDDLLLLRVMDNTACKFISKEIEKSSKR